MIFTIPIISCMLEIMVHECCGCSCYVCAIEHSHGSHTNECIGRFMSGFNSEYSQDEGKFIRDISTDKKSGF